MKPNCTYQHLEDLTEMIDYGYTASATTNPVGPRFLRITDIQDGQVNWQTVPFCNVPPEDLDRYALRPGDIVFARTGATTGKSFLISHCPEKAVFASYLIRVRPLSTVDPRYLIRFFESSNYWRQIRKGITGTAQGGLNASKLKRLAVPLPPLGEQKRIAAILDKADEIRRKREKAIELTDSFLRSVFLEMFGDPVTNPKGWPITTIGDATEAIKDGPHVSPEYAETGVPILSTRNIRPGRLILEDLKHVSSDTYAEITRRFRPSKGDVLLTKGGTTGYAKSVDWDWPFAVWVHLAVLRPKATVRPLFLEHMLNSEFCYKQSQRFTRGIANRDLGLTRIAKIHIPLPPIQEQLEFEKIVTHAAKVSTSEASALNHLKRLSKCLNGYLLSGKETQESDAVVESHNSEAHALQL
ncbi:MAG: restriction endonuclease subunit S [Bdellovibrionota bacterium]